MPLTHHDPAVVNKRRGIQGLYAITPDRPPTLPVLLNQVEQAIIGGAGIIQYRDKGDEAGRRRRYVTALSALCRRHEVLLIVNDDPYLARDSGAAGVHLGQDDASISTARELLGEQAIIGVSCYNRLDLALQAEQSGADYIAFGSFFPSPTKPEAVIAALPLLTQARQQLSIPIVAIGGITSDNGADLLSAGATSLAVVSGIFAQTDISAAAQAYARLFDDRQNP